MSIKATLHKTISYWVWVALFAVLALVLANTPLFNLLAFEFCAVLALAISLAGAHIALTTVHRIKHQPHPYTGSPRKLVIRCFLRALFATIALLGLPLVIILLNAVRVENCNLTEGMIFFLLLPGISALHATAAGVFCGLFIQRRYRGYLAYLGYLLLSTIPVLINLIYHPPVFAYHTTFGYFPGPIYDLVVPITQTLLIARTETLLWAALFLTLTVATCEISRDTALIPKLRWQRLRTSLATAITPTLLAIGVILFQLYASPLGLRPTRADIARELGGFRETAHFQIFYARELETEIQRIAEDCEFQYAQLVDYLGDENTQKVRAYIYESPEQKKQLIGAKGTSVEDPFGYGFHIHAQGFPHPVLKHELAHVFTVPWSPLKVSLKIGLHEGIAVAADWDEGRLTPHQWAKAMRQMEIAPPLTDIMGFGFWGHAGARSYLLAGSFVRYLVDTHGLEKFKNVFRTGDFRKAYGHDVQTLEKAWIEFLQNVPLQQADIAYTEYRLRQNSVFQQTCAHEMAARRENAWNAYARKDFRTAAETFETMRIHQPEDLRTLWGLMYTEYRRNRYQEALELATHIAGKADTRFSPDAHLLIGDIHWHNGDYEKAINAYTEMHTEYRTLERRRSKRIASLTYPDIPLPGTPENRTLRELLRDVLTTSKKPAEKVALLMRCREHAPNHWLADLLIGELLHEEDAWHISNRHLRTAIHRLAGIENSEHQHAQTLTTEQYRNLRQSAARTFGINAYHLKDYRTAIQTFAQIAEDRTLPHGTKNRMADWERRCLWAQQYSENAMPIP